MSRVYADTSFWVSLYVPDANSDRADLLVERSEGIIFNRFVEHELRNAIRLCVFRNQITFAQSAAIFEAIEADEGVNLREKSTVIWSRVFDRAEKLSSQFTSTTGHRGADILHVAFAMEAGVQEFITFDHRQADLVREVGLEPVS